MKGFLSGMMIVFLCCSSAAFAQEEAWVPAAIHISTTISDGTLSLDEVLKAARARGIKAVISTDRDFMKWEYGLWPLRNIIKKSREMNSVFKYGVDKYLHTIELQSSSNGDMVIIPGIESAPFYYWSGIPFSGDFKLSDWHKHVLILGLDEPQDYKNLPVVANKSALKKPFGFKNLLLFWPVLTISLGVFFFKKREYSYRDFEGRELAQVSQKSRLLGIGMAALSILFIINNFPFCFYRYDQYSLAAGSMPYQVLFDYVRREGGLTFWAHPEAKYMQEQAGVKIETKACVDDLWKTDGYTGFSLFYEGYEQVGKIGGDWDQILSQYCSGKRRFPVWAIAGLAFDTGTSDNLLSAMADLQTYVLTKTFSRQGILEAMRHGRMYVSRGSVKTPLLLKKFIVEDRLFNQQGTMGDEVRISANPVIEIKGEFAHPENQAPEAHVVLVRDGKIIETFTLPVPFDISYEDKGLLSGRSFYRLEIKCAGQLIVTNPIFVTRKTSKG